MFPENELYEKWKVAQPEHRAELEKLLFSAIQRHVRGFVWLKLGETNEDLVQEIAIAAMDFKKFREECLLSTWVEVIAGPKCNELVRKRVRRRKVFDENIRVFEEVEDHEEDRGIAPGVEIDPVSEIAAKELAEGFSPDERTLWEGIQDGLEQAELAELLGIKEHAAESRRRKLREKLNKKWESGDG